MNARTDTPIAVVDDDPSVRKALERVLRAGGHVVATYASGNDLLQALEHSKPHCIVLDLHMPGFDGFQLQAALARGGWRIPVIMITGHYDSDAAARAKELGAVVCLPKPVESAALLDAIAACVHAGNCGTS